ncbi:MAG: glycosyltransferase [Clostridiales bacterium]|nr:glycosyltransferase [Clostridiales bacterium]
MKILLINSVCGIRSTGRICTDLARRFISEGHEVKIAYGRVDEVPEEWKPYAVRIGGDLDLKLHALRTRMTDGHGLGSKNATRAFLKWAEDYQPDLLWLHNLHGYYINVELLFRWIKQRPQMQVKWTLHDCWAFTGHCSHFSFVGCDKWKTHCSACPQKDRYPISFVDGSSRNYDRKKASFTGVKNMTLITPSHWLANLARQSFLGLYPVEVQPNPIDKSVFRPTEGDFRKRHGLEGKKLVLGVASAWDDRKGLEDFYQLRNMLPEEFAIVLVGLDEKQLAALPASIVGIARTNNTRELAEIYTTADVYVNPSREETYSMTTAEALSCGTPAIVYEGTACEETAKQLGGISVPQDVNRLCEAILNATAWEGMERSPS